ncbi:MAG: xanthine dehydrogenase family protein subunit M [Planctomycetales bacterium]|nr:xanthine dehydrogenase family protein subunit M [Planctomycetales bacterium]
MRAFEYLSPKTLEAASAAVRTAPEGARIIAGGQDLLGELKERIATPGRVVSLKAVPGLRGIREESGSLRIGALATVQEVAESPLVREKAPALAEAATSVGTPQIRALGTVGGNLCQRPRCWYYRLADFPCLKKGGGTCFAVEGDSRYHAILGGGPCHIVHPSDLAVALVALDASVEVVGAKGRRTIPIADLYALPAVDASRETTLAPDEIVAEVSVPAGARSAFRKFREKLSLDFAVVAAAVALGPKGPRVALGGVAPVPWRSREAEAALGAKPVTAESAAAAATAALAPAKPLKNNRYKVPLACAVLRRTILAAAGVADPGPPAPPATPAPTKKAGEDF